ncbi:MAG TPA: hypothetical protein VK493_01180 [Bryobacteraceae bacterium]|nr:hypothetical protein [Bryobacteraceae bacterium]
MDTEGDSFEVVGLLPKTNEFSSGTTKHSFDARGHFLFVYEFATVQRGKALSNGSPEPGVFFEEPVHGFLDHLHRVSAGVASELLKLSFLFRCQMHFHVEIVDVSARPLPSSLRHPRRGHLL